jgi:hypothetical protein
MDELEAALAIDSTFAKAAIYLNGVACWTFECGGPRAQRAARLAWEHRHRLSDYDRFWLEADRGGSSPAERLAIRQRLVATRPDDPAAWYRLAWTTYQYGAWLGVEDSEALAAEHLRRSLDLGAPLRGTVLNSGFVFYEDGSAVERHFGLGAMASRDGDRGQRHGESCHGAHAANDTGGGHPVPAIRQPDR